MKKTEKLTLKLSATPTRFSLSLRKNFIIEMMATNEGYEIIDPELHAAELLINGKESFAWMETIGNGLRSGNWFSLPPHQSVSMSWATIGDQLFPTSGEYILQLQLRTIKSEQIKITVLKD